MSSDERLWGLPKEIGEASPSSSPIVELERRASRLTRLLDAIRAVSDEGAQSHGPSFFRTFTRRLCEVLDTEYAFVGRLEQRGQVQTLALFAEGAHRTDFVYKLEGTPCANPASGHACAYADKVVDDFPSDRLLADLGIRGYAGIPLRVATGMTIGILVVLSKKPIDDPDFVISVLLFFATRAALELQETHVAEQLRERDLALRCLMDSNIVGFATLVPTGRSVTPTARSSPCSGSRVRRSRREVRAGNGTSFPSGRTRLHRWTLPLCARPSWCATTAPASR